MKKSLLSILLTFCLVLLLAPSAALADKGAVVLIGSADAEVGETIKLPVSLTSNPGIAAAMFDISYDETLLNLKSVEKGDVFSSGTFAFDEKAEQKTLFWFNYIAEMTATGVMFMLEFEVIGSGNATVDVHLSHNEPTNFINLKYDIVPVTFTPGIVHIAPNPNPNAHIVTYNANGGTVTPSAAATGIDGKLTALPTPTRTGYTFDGWYTAVDGGERVDQSKVYTENTTLYAHWTAAETPPTPTHTHDWAEAWTTNATHHWHECIAADCPITTDSGKDGYGPHTYDDDADTTCNDCGYVRTVTPPQLWEDTSYISIPQFTGGAITPTTRNAEPGERVTLYAHPDAGYELDTLTVTDIRGRSIPLRSLGDNAYSFLMPAARVTVDAVFTKTASNDTPVTTPAEDEPFTGLGTPGISGIVLNPAVMPFRDVKSTDWFYNSVDYVWKHYLMSGVSDTQFAPNLTTSRAMIWTILARMNNVRTDINPGSTWYEKGLLWAKERGVTDGTNPMSDITREQLAAMLWRNAGRPAPGAAADLSRFSDSDSVSEYAQTAVRWAASVGILNGSDGKIDPQGTATRAQVAAMVNRYGEKIGK